jgi:hypothetical protein
VTSGLGKPKNGTLAPLGRGFMQTLAFFWYELKAAKLRVKETFAEPQEPGKADLPANAEEPWRGIGFVDISVVPKLGCAFEHHRGSCIG